MNPIRYLVHLRLPHYLIVIGYEERKQVDFHANVVVIIVLTRVGVESARKGPHKEVGNECLS